MIELLHLEKVLGQRTALQVHALAVKPGEVAAVVGPAGSGKSLLLALLSGQARATAGTVRVAGLDPLRDRQALNRTIGVLFAENALYERLSTRANLLFHCRLRGLSPARADELLAQTGLADHAAVPAGRLPPGLARRLAFARALLHRPRVLLLQEPFGNCDIASRDLLARLIREFAADGGTVLLLASETAGLPDLCQAIYALDQGRVTRVDRPQEESPAELPFRVPARLADKVVLLNPADILYATVEEERTWLYTAGERLPTPFSLSDLEQRLTRSGFFRAHRSYLVNLQRVREVVPYTPDSFALILNDPAGTDIPLSKAAARELRDLLGY